jgi:L-amino acid N-acyltransferase YncA
MVRPEMDDSWFVTAFNTHPMHRTPDVLRELLLSFAQIVKRFGIRELKSNVYKTNQLSMAFHKHLGFRVTKENERGVEFTATLSELELSPAIRRTRHRMHRQHASTDA